MAAALYTVPVLLLPLYATPDPPSWLLSKKQNFVVLSGLSRRFTSFNEMACVNSSSYSSFSPSSAKFAFEKTTVQLSEAPGVLFHVSDTSLGQSLP